MFRILLIFTFLLVLNACSVDTKSGFWENKQIQSAETRLSDHSFDENLSFDEYKNNVIEYGKKSDFPKLMD
tara:strand:- start:3883 stop:4095 length:213 start_codon:yes stop_codon:yes gene_type:complete